MFALLYSCHQSTLCFSFPDLYTIHVVNPSFPHVFTGFDVFDAARIFLKLMKRLGHERFYAQGGDWGSAIVTLMSAAFPE